MPVIPSALPAPPAPPDAKIRFVYRCRLCGGLEASTGISPEGVPFAEAARILSISILGRTSSGALDESPILVSLHKCRNGQIGVTDLAGAWHD